jgi:TolB protein
MRLMLRVMAVLMGVITLLIGGVVAVARARTDTPPSAWIAFRGQTLPSSTGQITARGEGGIYVVRADGRVLRRVIEIDPIGNEWVRDLQWSPDGKWLLFTSDLNQAVDVYRVRVDGRQLQDLTGASGSNASPAWSPDGRWIVFASNRAGDFALYRMRPDGSDRQRLYLGALPTPVRIPAWSPDGEWIAFVQGGGFQDDVYRVRADGTELQRLTNNPQWVVENLAWSPDGASLIFQARGTAEARAVFRMSIENGNVQSLTAWQPEEYFQSMSPDGEWMITAKRESTGLKLFRMRTDGSDVRFLNPADISRLINQWGGIWSADGRWIAYMNMGGSSSVLYRLASEGGAAEQLTDPRLIVSSPVWSPPIDAPFRRWMVIGVGAVLVGAGIAPCSRIAWASRPQAIHRKDRERPSI